MSLGKNLFWIGLAISAATFGFHILKQPKDNFSDSNQTQSHRSRTNPQLSKNEFLYTKTLCTLLCHKVNQEKIKKEGLPATITHITNMLIQKHPEKADSFLYYHKKYNHIYYQVNDDERFINYLKTITQPQNFKFEEQNVFIQKIHTHSNFKSGYICYSDKKIYCR